MAHLRSLTGSHFPSMHATTLRLLLLMTFLGAVSTAPAAAAPREEFIPVLSKVLESNTSGTVTYVRVTFDTRSDSSGLVLRFKEAPGRFSHTAKQSIETAIRRAAQSLRLSADSWTVALSVSYGGITIYGESLSGMVGLSVAAMATGRTITPGLLMTGIITPEGRIGPVGSVPLQIPAAGRARLNRVLVAKDQTIAERDRTTLPVMQISPIGSVTQAFHELTTAPPSSDSR
ncbi:S16 family serine protease [Nitrospira sp. NS4]|uniref:S16 family serine protease n=1 Tax=Nitrospira sp. NS4 TaxID=3414498 RepID=UPI003C2E0977